MLAANAFTVEVRDRDFQRVGQIAPEYMNLKFVDVFNGVGAWELTLPIEHPLLPALRTKGSGVVITERWPGGMRVYSGRMRTARLTQSGEDPGGTWLIQGNHDNIIAAATVVYPDPANEADAQTQSHWNQSGSGETVMKLAVQANAGSTALPSRTYPWLGVATNLLRGQPVKCSSRFDVLGDLLTSLGTTAGLGWRFAQQGDGVTFDVFEPADKTKLVRLDIRNGGVESNELGFTAPAATRVLVMGQGEGEARTIIEVTSTNAEAEAAEWGIHWESTKDQRQTDDSAELIQAGEEVLTEQGETVNTITVNPSDAPNMRLGIDWYIGDRITAVVAGQETQALVTQVATSISAAGVIRQATIGDPTGFSFEAKVASKIKDQEKRIGQVERLIGQGTSWEDISGKPSVYPTNWANVAGKPSVYPTNWANVADKPTIYPTDWANVADKPAGAFAEAGDIKLTARSTAPAGWLLADGSAVSRTTYATLFAAIGTTYGAGNGSSTFNLPNLKGRVPVGRDAAQAEFDVLGEAAGAKTHTLTVAEMPDHQHNHNQANGGNLGYAGDGTTIAYTVGYGNSRLNTGVMTGSTGGGGAHNNLQPYLVLNYLIKT